MHSMISRLACRLIVLVTVVFIAGNLTWAQDVAEQERSRRVDENDIDFDEGTESTDEKTATPVRKGKEAIENNDQGTEKDIDEDQADENSTSLTLASIRLDSRLPEGSNAEDLFSTDRGTLLDIIRRLDEAGEDDDVDAVLLEIRNPGIGRGKLHEVRSEIQRLRDRGKRIYASLQSASPADYLVACACDVIVMPESGDLILPGLRAEVMFYQRLFKKLGIQADMLQVGDFKGAAEPYTRDGMSKPFRDQLTLVLDDLYQQMIEDIADSRGLSKGRVRELIDKGMMSAKTAREAGLIDVVAYEQDWRDALLKKHERDELEVLEDFAKVEVDTDFSGMGGFIRLMELLSGGKSSAKKSKSQKIAVVYAVGPIRTGNSGSSMFGDSFMGSDTIVKALQQADENDSVAAIVLRVNSPGGSALASDLIWNQIQQIEKPVVASMGDVAGSGGYYISMGCDEIFAEPGTITGSIGVVGGKLVTGVMFQRFGLTTEVISRGKNSGLFSTNAPFSEGEREAWQAMMDEVYEQFTSKAASGRKMDVDRLKKYAGGRIWTGRQAKKNGLVDEVGTLRDAVRGALRLAKLDENQTPELLILPKAKSVFEQLFAGESVAMPAVQMQLAESRAWEQLRELQQLFSEPCVLLMPYRIDIR